MVKFQNDSREHAHMQEAKKKKKKKMADAAAARAASRGRASGPAAFAVKPGCTEPCDGASPQF